MGETAANRTRFDYGGAHVLVTGGTSGLGNAIACAYRDAGARVTITGTRPAASDYEADLTGFAYLQLDVEDTARVDAVAAAQERLDILVNNAGVALVSKGLDESDPAVFERAVRVHLGSVYRMSSRCLGALRRSALAGGASVVGIASMSSYFGIRLVPGYGAAKTGLLGLTRALAVEWGGSNVRVNAVAVGLTETGMTAGMFMNPEWLAPTLARTPVGRLGQPRDVAGAVLFLTSAEASWITGQTLAVDGGYSISG